METSTAVDPPSQHLRMHLQWLQGFKRKHLEGLKTHEPLAYAGAEDYVLNRGREYPPTPLTDEEWAHVERVAEGPEFYPQRACFYNAQMLAASDPTGQLTYCEGWAYGAVIPCHHAWITLNGKVVDLTWRTAKPHRRRRYKHRNVGWFDPAAYAYFGVEFPGADWLNFWALNQMTAGPVLEASRYCLALYRGEDAAQVLPRRKS